MLAEPQSSSEAQAQSFSKDWRKPRARSWRAMDSESAKFILGKALTGEAGFVKKSRICIADRLSTANPFCCGEMNALNSAESGSESSPSVLCHIVDKGFSASGETGICAQAQSSSSSVISEVHKTRDFSFIGFTKIIIHSSKGQRTDLLFTTQEVL